MEKTDLEYWVEKGKKRDFILNNLFERDDGTWQANFRHKVKHECAEFGLGDEPSEALENAYRNCVSLSKKLKIEPKKKRKRKRIRLSKR